jgi:hypothetical protein
VFLCAFMFYNCRVDYVGATAEEKSAADSPPASRIHQCTSSGLLAALSFPLSSSTTAYVSPSRSLITLTDRRLFSVMSFGLSLSPPAPSLVATVCTTSKASSDLQPAAVLGDSYALQSQLSTMPVFIFSSLFTTASGERVKFSQAGGQWHATIQAGSGAYTSPRTLPVVSSSDIGSFLSWLRYQDMWTSRARIHVLDTSQAPNGSCIYLGKAGLLGGMPEFPSRGVSQELGATLQEVWVQGPTMHLEGNQTRTEVCYIQSGFRYKGYRIKEGSVIRRASYTISYVEADARAEINKLARCSNESELEEKLSTGFAQFVNLGNRAENVGSAQVRGHQSAHQFSLAHAAIMLYGSTEKNKIFQKKKSCLSLALEIQVVPDCTLCEKHLVKLQAIQAQQRREYGGNLVSVARKQTLVKSEYDASLETVCISLPILGEAEWRHYFGNVGSAPDLPSDIDTILGSECPFWPAKKVMDTHLLVLVPATVDDAPFTLNLLEELVQRPKNGGHRTRFRYYGDEIRAQIGEKSPSHAYWLLITHDVLPDSRAKAYSTQKELVSGYAERTGLLYELPHALEAATAILMHHVRTGERLFGDSPWTNTRCQELVADQYPAVVGGFESSGLNVNDYYDYVHYCHRNYGVACCRKF